MPSGVACGDNGDGNNNSYPKEPTTMNLTAKKAVTQNKMAGEIKNPIRSDNCCQRSGGNPTVEVVVDDILI